jgi:uncharacterized protein (TIGR03663 family)
MIALGGLALRLPQLGARPMHTDEAVNAYIVGQLLSGEAFKYDPHDRHGPALAAIALPLSRMRGARTFADLTESDLRLSSVLAGTATILLFGAAVEMYGFVPCLIAALLLAGSPMPVYYDRYFIHESLFVAATFGLILSGWRTRKGNSFMPAALAGACAALMITGKETAILHFFAMAAAALLFWFWNLRETRLRGFLRAKSMLVAAITFLALSLVLLSWFGKNWRAPVSLLHLIPDLLARAGGEGHQKPFWYYGQLLSAGWSGGILLALACIGLIITITKRDRSPFGFLVYYALFLGVIYSLIPYKTPWLTLNLGLPLSLFAARAVVSFCRMGAKRLGNRAAIPVVCVMGALTSTLIAHDTWQRVFAHPADENNLYAYAHTSEDVLGLSAEISDLARQNGIASPSIAVIASDPWPLPWYLRRFSQVGFWQPGQQPGEADFYITSTDVADQYADRLRSYSPDFFGMRPGVLILLWSPALK